MKKIRIFVMMLAMLTVLAANAENQVFKEMASKIKGVTYVFIPRAMLSNSEQLEITGVNTDIPIKKVLSIEIVYTEDKNSMKTARKSCGVILEKLKTQLLMEREENGEIVRIYTQGLTRNDKIMNAIIEVCTPSDYSLIYVAGRFDREELIHLNSF